jgi:ubiquinone biosynthesis protein
VQLPEKLSRYAAVATLLLKHRSALGGAQKKDVDGVRDHAADARRLTDDLERLGPTFIKLGQLLSGRADLLPPAYVDALARLQDDVAPFSCADAERIVESEIGVKLSTLFPIFEAEPIAAASLGQVHRAALRDGRMVAVKVQRPEAREQIAKDLKALAEIAALVDRHSHAGALYNFSDLVAEFRRTILAELEYLREAENLRVLARNLAGFDDIIVPQPIDDYCTSRVLTLDYVRGTKVTAISPLTRLDIRGEHLGRELLRAYLHQIVVDGFFHADPHPGNVFVTDNEKIALVDLGMVGHLSARTQARLLGLLMSASEGRGDDAADVLIELGERRADFDETALRREITGIVAACEDASLAQLQVGRLLLDVNQRAGAHGLKPPPELALLGKTLLNLDVVARSLAPDLDVNAVIRAESVTLMQRRMLQSVSPGRVLSTMLDAKQFAERLPGRVNRVLDALAGNELQLKVEMIDEGAVVEGLQKVANRVALGLVMAALIVAAALMMQVPTTFRVLGYPGIAMILLIVAASAGAMLAVHIINTDRSSRRRHT